MAPWQLLLHRTVEGLARLRATGQPLPQWVLGGGTALMIHAGHRLSKDIDAFIDDPQYLSFLSPRLAGEGIWACKAFQESAARGSKDDVGGADDDRYGEELGEAEPA